MDFGAHKKIVLSFSGGKDSLACLFLMREHWHDLSVVWVNTGDEFPETKIEAIRVAKMVPHFVEIKANQPEQIKRMGWPTEIVPITRTPAGRCLEGHSKQLLQSYLSCCYENRWLPMQQYIKSNGVTLVIRGTRLDDKRKSSVRHGDVVDGVEYWHPVESWSTDDVMKYLSEVDGGAPSHYRYTEASLDCVMCTACMHENTGKLRFMENFYPEEYAEVQSRIRHIRGAVSTELRHIRRAIL